VEKWGYGAESLPEALLGLGRYAAPWKLSEAGHGLFLSHQRQPGTERIQTGSKHNHSLQETHKKVKFFHRFFVREKMRHSPLEVTFSIA